MHSGLIRRSVFNEQLISGNKKNINLIKKIALNTLLTTTCFSLLKYGPVTCYMLLGVLVQTN